jgi:hypothetical protein
LIAWRSCGVITRDWPCRIMSFAESAITRLAAGGPCSARFLHAEGITYAVLLGESGVAFCPAPFAAGG